MRIYLPLLVSSPVIHSQSSLVDEAPLHIDDIIINELVSTKRTLYKPNYPHRMKEEFIPRDNPLKPVISPQLF